MSTSPSRTLIALCLAAGMLAACASAEDTSTSGDQVEGIIEATDLPSTVPPAGGSEDGMERPDPDMTADVRLPATGAFGLAEVEGGCAYVEIDGERYELLASSSADVAVDPANGIIADSTGEVIAQAGDEITVDGTVDPGIVTFCQIGPVIVADSITAG